MVFAAGRKPAESGLTMANPKAGVVFHKSSIVGSLFASIPQAKLLPANSVLLAAKRTSLASPPIELPLSPYVSWMKVPKWGVILPASQKLIDCGNSTLGFCELYWLPSVYVTDVWKLIDSGTSSRIERAAALGLAASSVMILSS